MQYLVRIMKLKRAFWRPRSLTTARNVAGLKRERAAQKMLKLISGLGEPE
jgi:hypothetical protein